MYVYEIVPINEIVNIYFLTPSGPENYILCEDRKNFRNLSQSQAICNRMWNIDQLKVTIKNEFSGKTGQRIMFKCDMIIYKHLSNIVELSKVK